MIRNQWYAVLEGKQVPRGKPVGATRMGEKLVFWRDKAGKVACISDICCHRGAALSLGEVHGDHVACPFHAFAYDSTGQVRVIPANGKNAPVPERYRVKSYPVREVGGLVFLWWGDEREKLPEVPFFDDLLDSRFSYGSFHDPWPVHYSRSVENQLDVMHVPFVHYNTIGRGCRTLVHGPSVQVDGTRLTFRVKNVADDGSTVPEKPEEVTGVERLTSLQFQFPNLWQNLITDRMRVFAAFAPVDEQNSVVYIRYYQAFTRLPVLRHLVNWLGIVFSKKVLAQDKAVVVTQVPVRSDYAMGEKLAQGDRPIAEYRRVRYELMRQAGQLGE